MVEAGFYDRVGGGRVRCRLCPHGCVIKDGDRGRCGVRENQGGTLHSLVYGRVVARDVDPIEKKPLYHLRPASLAYSIATVGCNLTCPNCQNHTISQYPREAGGEIAGDEVTPWDIVDAAKAAGCETIAYTYTEPTVFLEFALDVARLARERGVGNVFVSNGFMTREAVDAVAQLADGVNIDLKGIRNDVYRTVFGGDLRPVLHAIERFVEHGTWVEVTTLVIPGLNDSPRDLRWTAEAIVGISPSIPWHVSRFFPAYRMCDVPPTPLETLRNASRLGKAAGLRYVYLGNVPGEGETTRCPSCDGPVIERRGYRVLSDRLIEGRCPGCGAEIEGVWVMGAGS